MDRHSLARLVAERLLDEIEAGGVAPGERMPSERELMQVLGVGRSTIREALNGLAMLGVIEIRHGQGAFVADRSKSRPSEAVAAALAKGVTRDLFEAREAVELVTARLAAERRTETDLVEMEDVLAEHGRLLEAGLPVAGPSALFHLRLADAAHNEVLAGCVASFLELLVERGPALEELPGYPAWEIHQHRGLFDAVRQGAGDLAVDRMGSHLAGVAEYHTRLGLDPDGTDGATQYWLRRRGGRRPSKSGGGRRL